MSLISVNNLTFCYEGSADYIFNNVSFMIDTDWKLGFVGRNGRGKTTFLNLLRGKFEYNGNISHSVEFDYFPFEVTDKSANTLDVLYRIVPNLESWRLMRELNLLEVAEDCLYRSFDTLSGGEQSKSLLAALFLKDNNFLLIDEPTNHLDIEGRRTVSRYLNEKKSFILVSHDRYFLDGCVDHILSINRADIEVQRGNFSSWLENKQRQDKFELAENEKLKNEISRLKYAAKRKSDWSDKAEKEKIGGGPCDRGNIGHKAAKVMKTAKVIESRQNRAIEDKTKLLKNIESADKLKICPLEHYSQRLAEISDLSVAYDGREIFSGFNMSVNSGERLALTGKNGSGKSSVLRLLLGEDIPYSGQIRLASKLKISYVPQNTSWLNGGLKDFVAEQGLDETLFMTILAKLDFSKTQFEKDMSQFSSGQKKKVLIARSLCENAHLYVWDEPLNFIDILSRLQIESLILNSNLTMLFVEHDSAFCEKISTNTILIG